MNKQQSDEVWKLIDEVEFQLMSLKDELHTAYSTSIATIIENQRKQLLLALRKVRGY